MEKTLEKQLEETFRLPGVAAKGIAQKENSGSIASIAKQAAALHPKSETPPVISIESDNGSVLIKSD
ncbi:hypothetical protein KUTeg_021078 [Tegillarca granosa]|uniref:Late endosomal/lysosomal adaptor and MAPK and MTOR activator 5 n=1 Tax=Tegillarca granosa TaxID=220873 RepID=A0ABQ9E9R3_TEGGR|nr:hypothetical protein KUTeg_021078 [Tegillarca granosa]